MGVWLLGVLRRLGAGKGSGSFVSLSGQPRVGRLGGQRSLRVGMNPLGYFQGSSGYGFGGQAARVQILGLSVLGCVTLSKLLNLSEPQKWEKSEHDRDTRTFLAVFLKFKGPT